MSLNPCACVWKCSHVTVCLCLWEKEREIPVSVRLDTKVEKNIRHTKLWKLWKASEKLSGSIAWIKDHLSISVVNNKLNPLCVASDVGAQISCCSLPRTVMTGCVVCFTCVNPWNSWLYPSDICSSVYSCASLMWWWAGRCQWGKVTFSAANSPSGFHFAKHVSNSFLVVCLFVEEFLK